MSTVRKNKDCDACSPEHDGQNKTFAVKFLLRQLFICSGVWTSYFMIGLNFGAPTMFIPQIRRENSTEDAGEGVASWLCSATDCSGFFCIIVISIITAKFGRKLAFFVACVDALLAYIVFFSSVSVIQTLISEIMQGLFNAGELVVATIIMTEYTSPKYRGMFLALRNANFNCGILVGKVIEMLYDGKIIGWVSICCAVYTVTTVLMWPESPYWLASKERYMECAENHRWLKGCDEDSEKELKALMNAQEEYISNQPRKTSLILSVRFWFVKIISKAFYKLFLLALSSALIYIFSGKFVCAVYIFDTLKSITGNESNAYIGTLILDGVAVASMYAGCILSKFVKRRLFLLTTSFFVMLFLYILSLYIYMISKSVIDENSYLSLGLLIIFNIAISSLSVCTSAVREELLPLRSRNSAICLVRLTSQLLYAVVLKTAPLIYSLVGLHGILSVYGMSSSAVFLVLYKYLPETKDKTLLEIADSMIPDEVTHM